MQAETEIDYRHYAGVIRKAFRQEERGGDNILGDYIQSHGKDPNAAAYRVRRTSSVTHATETRRGGQSAVLINEQDWANSRVVRCINALREPFPDVLRGRYHPVPTIAERAAVNIPVLKRFRKAEPMMKAKTMLDYIYQPEKKDGEFLRYWEAMGFEHDEWANHPDRKIWDTVNHGLRSVVQPAIAAFVLIYE